MVKDKIDNAYTERMMVIRLLAVSSDCKYGVGKDGNEDWEDEWRNVVYVDLPQGQVSWHIAPHDMHLFEDFPQYDGEWDGKFSGKDLEFIKSVEAQQPKQDTYQITDDKELVVHTTDMDDNGDILDCPMTISQEELEQVYGALEYASKDDIGRDGTPFVPKKVYIKNVQHLTKKALNLLKPYKRA